MQNPERVIITEISPRVKDGYPAKRVVGESVDVAADIFADGHDVLSARVQYKPRKGRKWRTAKMTHGTADRWSTTFVVDKQGEFQFKVEGWVDHALTWLHGLEKKIASNQADLTAELLDGVQYAKAILKSATTAEKSFIKETIKTLADTALHPSIEKTDWGKLEGLFKKYPQPSRVTTSSMMSVYVDRTKARFSTWYELFPRSTSAVAGEHGTFEDCGNVLPYVADMGFDVIYLPPIHPIGYEKRLGKNATPVAENDDVGSAWGIGSAEGGHKDIHPQLGTLSDFKQLTKKAEGLGIEIAMDIAFQCAPDHPYIKEHPQWFKWRPDGTAQYAENPPKKYIDIIPIDFETSDWKKLWNELFSVFMYWIETCGIKIFRIDNPHTKPFHFWEWVIENVKKKYPDTLFLSEAFTRPTVMHKLAEIGYSQSYTYFVWKNTKQELIEYINELTNTNQKEYYRPNFWVNTPDINPIPLQGAAEGLYMLRYFLAATLSSNTGMYGPVYEKMIADAPDGKEEYLHSEKYEARHWQWVPETPVHELIKKINQIRKSHPSLQQTNDIVFCNTNSDELIAYYKYDIASDDHVLMVASLRVNHTIEGWVQLPLDHINKHGDLMRVEDLLTGNQYEWKDEWVYIKLEPTYPFHLFTFHN